MHTHILTHPQMKGMSIFQSELAIILEMIAMVVMKFTTTSYHCEYRMVSLATAKFWGMSLAKNIKQRSSRTSLHLLVFHVTVSCPDLCV